MKPEARVFQINDFSKKKIQNYAALYFSIFFKCLVPRGYYLIRKIEEKVQFGFDKLIYILNT